MGSNGPNISNLKPLKPSELNLDMIGSNMQRNNIGMKGGNHQMHNQTPLALGRSPPPLNNQQQNVTDILNNFKTPQNLKKIELRNSSNANTG